MVCLDNVISLGLDPRKQEELLDILDCISFGGCKYEVYLFRKKSESYKYPYRNFGFIIIMEDDFPISSSIRSRIKNDIIRLLGVPFYGSILIYNKSGFDYLVSRNINCFEKSVRNKSIKVKEGI